MMYNNFTITEISSNECLLKSNSISVLSRIVHAVLQPRSKHSVNNVKIAAPMQKNTHTQTQRDTQLCHILQQLDKFKYITKKKRR